jgi:pyruvate/2-oxoglutarate dehydrogenase complex dihydrolipoamide acyltransferase (E2) component
MTEKTRLHASPYARKTARELGVALETLTGTGPNGRIVWRDVEAASKTSEKPSDGMIAGYYTTADVSELLAALKTLDGALTFPAFAERAGARLNVPVRCAGDGLEGALPTLKSGATAAMAVGDPMGGYVRIHLAYDSGGMSDETAAKLLRSMRELLEKPLTMLV